MQIKYVPESIHIDEEAIINAIAARAEKHLAELGEHVAEVARGRAPVGKESHSSRGFQRVQLRPPGAFPSGRTGSRAEASFELHQNLLEAGRAGLRAAFKKGKADRSTAGGRLLLAHFQGTRKGGTIGVSPTHIEVRGNTIVGRFSTHEAGNLRNSIHFVGVERQGNRVVATVRAEAPYAMAIHEGFKHRGGSDKQGTVTEIPGRPFLKNALVNIQSRLTEPSAYEG